MKQHSIMVMLLLRIRESNKFCKRKNAAMRMLTEAKRKKSAEQILTQRLCKEECGNHA